MSKTCLSGILYGRNKQLSPRRGKLLHLLEQKNGIKVASLGSFEAKD